MGEIIETIVIGAGPAGLTAAYTLAKHKCDVLLLEQDPTYVGGISRTANYKGFLFDIGGHRFFSKSKEVVDLWNEILPDDFLERPRLSRIFYRGKFYSYPLNAFEAFKNLGLFESALCMVSFLFAKIIPVEESRAPFISGCATSLASACSTSSSKPTPRRFGAWAATKSPPTGQRSGSRASSLGAAIVDGSATLARASQERALQPKLSSSPSAIRAAAPA